MSNSIYNLFDSVLEFGEHTDNFIIKEAIFKYKDIHFKVSTNHYGQTRLDMYTLKPNGEIFTIARCIGNSSLIFCNEGTVEVLPGLHIKIGAWVYEVCRGIQHLVELDKIKSEREVRERKSQRDEVNEYFMNKGK